MGATLYALLTGRPPFVGDSLPQLIQQVRDADPAAPKEFQLSIADSFEDVVMRLLAKKPEERYQTAHELLNDLERIGQYNNLDADS